MAISDKLTKLTGDISDAYDTVETMGGTIPSDKNTNNLSTAISTIPQGSPTPTGDFRVRFIDVDGTILKEEWVNKGEDATPPANPSYDSTYLTFAEWNNPYTNIQDDLDIGAVYDTKNNEVVIIKLYFYPNIQKKIEFYYINPDVAGTIDWGDGNTETLSVSSERTQISHTYSTKNYFDTAIIKITGVTNFKLTGSSDSSAAFTINYAKNIVAIYFGTNYNMDGTGTVLMYTTMRVISMNKNATGLPAIQPNYSLTAIIIPKNIISADNAATFQCDAVKFLVNPITVTYPGNAGVGNSLEYINSQAQTDLKGSEYSYKYFLKFLNLKNVTTISMTATSCRNCYSLKEVYFEKITSFSQYNILFSEDYNLEAVILNTNSVVTLGSTAVFAINSNASTASSGNNLKIYVPDRLLNNYKTASNWSTFASIIKPISELPTTSHFYPYVRSQINNN